MNCFQLLSRALGGPARRSMHMPNSVCAFSQSVILKAEPVGPKPSTVISSLKSDSNIQPSTGKVIRRDIPIDEFAEEFQTKPTSKAKDAAAEEKQPSKIKRLPMSVQAIYLKPMKRTAKYGISSCDLQLRSYSLRPLEFYSDFALRAAYYLGLAAYGPVPLPQITERWTVPRSHFIFKKSQQNFERVTKRRLIQIRDGDPEAVQVWLAFLRKHAFYGVGMKANVWEFSKLGVGKEMDAELPESETMKHAWEHFAQDRPYKFKDLEKLEKLVEEPKFMRPYRDGNGEVKKA